MVSDASCATERLLQPIPRGKTYGILEMPTYGILETPEGIVTFSVNIGIPKGFQFNGFFQSVLTVPAQVFELPEEVTVTVVGLEFAGEHEPYWTTAL
jgi:hypothetical protein